MGQRIFSCPNLSKIIINSFYLLTFLSIIVDIFYQSFLVYQTGKSFWTDLQGYLIFNHSLILLIISLILAGEFCFYFYKYSFHGQKNSLFLVLIFLSILILIYRSVKSILTISWGLCREFQENITFKIITKANGYSFDRLSSHFNCPNINDCLESSVSYIFHRCHETRTLNIILASCSLLFFVLFTLSSFILK